MEEQRTKQFIATLSALADRMLLATRAGQTFGGDRDLFTALGYKKEPKYLDFLSLYRYGDIAKRIVTAFPAATWRKPPEIREDKNDENETEFEKAWKALNEKLGIFHILQKADRLAGIGKYSVLLLGLKGEAGLEAPAQTGELIYLSRYGEGSASIKGYESNPTSERFGLPKTYELTIRQLDGKTKPQKVHHSRIIHIAEDTLEDDVFGCPRLEPVFNKMQDLIKVVGGSSEMFWLAATRRMHLDVRDGADMSDDEVDDLRDELDEFQHDLRKVLRTQGIDVKELFGQTADPRGNVEVILDLVAGTVGIPKRILVGSERGELASTQDQSNWNQRIAERQENHAEPAILRPLIDRLMEVGALPKVVGYEVQWPDVTAPSQSEKIENAQKLATGANALIPGGAELVITKQEFRETAGLDPEPDAGFPEDELEDLVDEDDPDVVDQFQKAG